MNGPDRTRVRLAARILGTLVGVMWLVPLIGAVFSREEPSSEGDGLVGVVLVGLVLAALVSLVVAYRNEAVGGKMLLGSGTALCVFAVLTAGRNHWMAVLVAGVPWLVVGAMFLLARRVTEPI